MFGYSTKLVLFITIAVAFIYIAPTQARKRLVCYYTNWPQYRPGAGKFTVANVDPFACTHLVFAFARVQDNAIHQYEWNDVLGNGRGAYSQLTALKQRNPNLMVFLGLGGWTHGPDNFTLMASNQYNRQHFIMNSISVLRQYNFDGIDLDWEYPGLKEPADKQNLPLLLQEMLTAYQQEARNTNRRRLMISMAVAAGIKNAEKAYDIPLVDRYIDMYNLMTYDYHGAWEDFTGLAAPMYSSTGDLSVTHSVTWYLQQGATASKINLGLSFYGRTWTLQTPGDLRLGAHASANGTQGRFTRAPGSLAYYEICGMIQRQMRTMMDPTGLTMYGVLGDQFVTYENGKTLAIKLDYIEKTNLGGAMIWALDHDDFSATFCRQGKNPLLTVVKNGMERGTTLPQPVTRGPPVVVQPATRPPVIVQPVTRPPVIVQPVTRPAVTRPPVATVQPRTRPPHRPSRPVICPSGGDLVADPNSCTGYYLCNLNHPTRTRYECRWGTIFNPINRQCEPRNATTYVCPLLRR